MVKPVSYPQVQEICDVKDKPLCVYALVGCIGVAGGICAEVSKTDPQRTDIDGAGCEK